MRLPGSFVRTFVRKSGIYAKRNVKMRLGEDGRQIPNELYLVIQHILQYDYELIN